VAAAEASSIISIAGYAMARAKNRGGYRNAELRLERGALLRQKQQALRSQLQKRQEREQLQEPWWMRPRALGGVCAQTAYGEPWCRHRCMQRRDCTATPRQMS
jgi:hypothetical protein